MKTLHLTTEALDKIADSKDVQERLQKLKYTYRYSNDLDERPLCYEDWRTGDLFVTETIRDHLLPKYTVPLKDWLDTQEKLKFIEGL